MDMLQRKSEKEDFSYLVYIWGAPGCCRHYLRRGWNKED